MNQLEKAVATLRLHQLSVAETNDSLTFVLRESLRLKKALEFYATPGNYIDGVPMLRDSDGLFTVPDDGWLAQDTLRRHDYPGTPQVLFKANEEGELDGLSDTQSATGAVTH